MMPPYQWRFRSKIDKNHDKTEYLTAATTMWTYEIRTRASGERNLYYVSPGNKIFGSIYGSTCFARGRSKPPGYIFLWRSVAFSKWFPYISPLRVPRKYPSYPQAVNNGCLFSILALWFWGGSTCLECKQEGKLNVLLTLDIFGPFKIPSDVIIYPF